MEQSNTPNFYNVIRDTHKEFAEDINSGNIKSQETKIYKKDIITAEIMLITEVKGEVINPESLVGDSKDVKYLAKYFIAGCQVPFRMGIDNNNNVAHLNRQ